MTARPAHANVAAYPGVSVQVKTRSQGAARGSITNRHRVGHTISSDMTDSALDAAPPTTTGGGDRATARIAGCVWGTMQEGVCGEEGWVA